MIRNYFKIAFRIFNKEKGITLTNILGMSLGITCSILIYLWVQDELSYNTFPKDSNDTIATVMTNQPYTNGGIETSEAIPQPLKAVLEEKYPAIEKVALYSWEFPQFFKKGDAFIQQLGTFASPEIFDILKTPFIIGNHELLYTQNKAIAISETFAKSYFGKDWKTTDVIGKYITHKSGDTFEVAGIYKDIPKQSTINFEYVIPFKEKVRKNKWLKHWGNFTNLMIVKLADNISFDEANKSVKNAIIDNRTDYKDTTEELLLQPFSKYYLYNRYEGGKATGGRIEYVRLLSIVAILILLLASINFINLSTARAANRAKETGVKKVLGALKFNLKAQFITESVLITFLGFILSIITVLVVLPYFNELTGKEINLNFFNLEFILYLSAFIIILGFFAGIYPAFYLSALNPIRSLKGVYAPNKNEGSFRKSLIVFQFIITTVMIIGAITVYKQVDYIQNKNTGFTKENLVEVFMEDINPKRNYTAYRQELLNKPGIKNVTAINQDIFNIGSNTTDPEWNGKTGKEEVSFHIMCTDPNFLNTTGIQLKSGRDFDWKRKTDTSNFIINEAARKAMSMKNPIGEDLEMWGTKGKIIGVIEDVHIHSLHTSIEPFIIRYDLPMTHKMLVRIEANKTKEALASLEELNTKFNPGKLFSYNFISDRYHNQYKSEYLVKDLMFYFTLLAIFISCMGLFSLISYVANQKAKEISIRKILGASVLNILQLLSKDFLKLISIAMAIAIPLGYYIISGWLEKFAYHIQLNWMLFTLAVLITMAITLFIVCIKTIKTATENPIKSLKNE